MTTVLIRSKSRMVQPEYVVYRFALLIKAVSKNSRKVVTALNDFQASRRELIYNMDFFRAGFVFCGRRVAEHSVFSPFFWQVEPFSRPTLFNPFGQVLLGQALIFIGIVANTAIYGNYSMRWQQTLAPAWAGIVVRKIILLIIWS